MARFADIISFRVMGGKWVILATPVILHGEIVYSLDGDTFVYFFYSRSVLWYSVSELVTYWGVRFDLGMTWARLRLDLGPT